MRRQEIRCGEGKAIRSTTFNHETRIVAFKNCTKVNTKVNLKPSRVVGGKKKSFSIVILTGQLTAQPKKPTQEASAVSS